MQNLWLRSHNTPLLWELKYILNSAPAQRTRVARRRILTKKEPDPGSFFICPHYLLKLLDFIFIAFHS